VIFEIPALVSELLPGLLRTGSVHIVCVRTTRAKFLVFDSDPARPACVVQFGPGEELGRLHGILSRLHGKLPEAVPESLVCRPWRGGEFVHIQAGLAGMPWFRLRESLGSPKDWDRLRERACEVISRFHGAVRDFPEWCCRVRPGEELRRQAVICRDRGVDLSRRASEWADACAERLDVLGEVTGFAQHGDFCLNNLMISASGLAIIDFDEFGRTFVPLQDEIGLALSFQHFAPRGGRLLPLPTDLACLLRNCRPECPDLFAHLSGLLLHHLLWRINQSQDWPARAGVRRSLVAMVEEFAASPGDALSVPRSRAKPTLDCAASRSGCFGL
jgi:hypothetical protein